jgi:pilus assembly protein CpaB
MFKGITPLVIAMGLALAAAATAYIGIKSEQTRLMREWKKTSVVVASRDIQEGTVLSVDMIAERDIPEQFVTSSVVRPGSVDAVINQKVVVPLQAGDPLLWTQFETTRMQQRLSTVIEKKARAITIDAQRSAAVGGWVRPNDHVDVIGTFKDPHSNEDVAVTLLQNVIVLATGKITGTTNINLIPEPQREYQNVSLLVFPAEAELLTLAAELGQLKLVLRNDEDTDMMEDRAARTTIQTLLSGERTKALQAIRNQTMIQILHGPNGAVERAPVTGRNVR